MAGKDKGVLVKETVTTPRRLRSGTHYGDQNHQPPCLVKKEHRKLLKDASQLCDGDNCSKGEKGKENKGFSFCHDSEHLKPPRMPISSVTSTNHSPEQLQKGQTLKAILESIEPNLCLKDKTPKRKSLRDLLDHKLFRERIDLDQANGANGTDKVRVKVEKPVSNGEYYGYVKKESAREVVCSPEEHSYDLKPKLDTSPTQNASTHTQTSSAGSQPPTVKEEPPDDYWAMKLNYPEKTPPALSSSVELRIQAAGVTHNPADERGQTFRISCSRPEAMNGCCGVAARTMKPDIVLKVRPRSSSLSSVCRPASHASAWGSGAVSGSQEGQSAGRPAVSPLKCVKTERGLESLTPACSDKDLHATVTSQGCSKTLTFDPLTVLEESKIPPVASTVELLSEPAEEHHRHHHHHHHRRHHHHHHHSHHHHDAGYTAHSLQDDTSTALSPCQPLIRYTASPRPQHRGSFINNNTIANISSNTLGSLTNPRTHEDEDNDNGNDRRDPSTHSHQKQNHRDETDDGPSPSPHRCAKAASSPTLSRTGREKERGERCGWVSRGGAKVERRRGEKQRSSDRSRTAAAREDGHAPDDSGAQEGPRRRRKGRPSRRAKTNRPWQTVDLCLSPASQRRPEEGGKHNGGGSPPGGKEREVGPGKPASRSSSVSAINTRKGSGRRQGDSGSGARRARKAVDLETLWANPQLDTHAFLLWASENRGEVERRKGAEGDGREVEEVLASQWTQMSFAGKLHFLCRARDAGTDHSRHVERGKKKAPAEKKDQAPSDGRDVYEQFLLLPQERQKDLLRKWLRFFQKMLPRLEYQDFISDFKKACKSLSLRPVPARRKNARLRNLDPCHYHMLFEKIRETRPRVISVYNKRKAREEELLSQSFSAMVRRLIAGQPWPFVRGCRSKVLGELLKDIQQLEVEEVLAQIDFPLTLTSGDLSDPFLSSKDLQEAGGPLNFSADVTNDIATGETSRTQTGNHSHNRSTDGHSRKGPNGSSANFATNGLLLQGGPAGDAELPDSPFVLHVLDSLRHVPDMPVLDQRCLDSVFLAPPVRSRSQTSRDTQFQNSATYRRTLLYKHIQPLLDARGMPLPSSALYHSHSAQYFYSDDR